MFVNKLFSHISKSKRCFNVICSTYYFHMKTRVLADFQICISEPLSEVAAMLPILEKLKARMCERLGVSVLSGKRVKEDKDSVMRESHLFCNNSAGFDDFSMLFSNNNDFKATLMESLLINRDHPPLNKNRHSLHFKHFDD